MSAPRTIAAIPLLTRGAHSSSDPEAQPGDLCAMEAVAWLAGEEHSDSPACASVALSRCIIPINDWRGWRSDKDRTDALLLLLPKIIGTRESVDDSALAGRLARFAVCTLAPMALDAAGLQGKAEKLRGLPAYASLLTLRDAAADAADAANAAAYAARAAAAAAPILALIAELHTILDTQACQRAAAALPH